MVDPLHPIFATEFVRALDGHIKSAGPMMHRVLEGAANSAEGTNVEPFHGVVEVVQNADDQHAGEVRLTLRDGPRGRQMLLVHDGQPVTLHHVAGMMLPYVTTKADDADLRGRFGIGLKTLRRISDAVAVHSGPYHFGSGAGVSILNVDAEPEISGFFDTARDTMLVLDLQDFDEDAFESWFADWTDDALIFLDRVRRVAWHKDDEVSARLTLASAWSAVGKMADGSVLERRSITAGQKLWTVSRAAVLVPPDRQRAHKRTATTTPVSVAFCNEFQLLGLYVGFQTRVSTHCPFAIDAQFDPSSSRESILDNPWNAWLVQRIGDVLGAAAVSLLEGGSSHAWQLVPVPNDTLGDAGTKWPREAFDTSMAAARTYFADRAIVPAAGVAYGLADLCYEAEELSLLLDASDVCALGGRTAFVSTELRDAEGRWRVVLDLLGTAVRVGVSELLSGIASEVLAVKPAKWWVRLASTVTEAEAADMLLGVSFWLTDDSNRVAAALPGETHRLIVHAPDVSTFALKHGLFDRLHPDFGEPEGAAALAWLGHHAAFSKGPSGADELRAFAESRQSAPSTVDDPTLQDLRALMDPITGPQAAEIGRALGRAILLEASEARKGAPVRNVAPSEAYLPKAIDKDNPNWPKAAAGIGGILWVLPSYEDRLRTGLGRSRKRDDGIMSRGARRFLTLLGVNTTPRVTPLKPSNQRTALQRAALSALDANEVEADWESLDLEKVLAAITGKIGRLPIKERRERAAFVLKALAREWGRFAPVSQVPSQKRARVKVHPRRNAPAHWICQLREAEWVPVGKTGFRRPGEAVLKNASTEAVYGPGDFVAGVDASDVPEDLAVALGLVQRVRASDVVRSLEQMRSATIPFDRIKVRQAYKQLDKLVPRNPWEAFFGDLTSAQLRARFAAGGGLVVVDSEGGRPTWRRPDQVLRGRQILPGPARYVPEAEGLSRLWRFLGIQETRVEDCCTYLKDRADRHEPNDEPGILIEVYGYLNGLLSKEDAVGADKVRHLPLACGDAWRARRPVFLVEQQDLRTGLATAMQDRFFWDPPCRTASIPHLVASLGLTRLSPQVVPTETIAAVDRGEELAHTFREAVNHLSDQLARTAYDVRDALTVTWDQLRSTRFVVYDGAVPVTVRDPALPTAVATSLRVHLSKSPLALFAAEDALGARDGVGRAIASLFRDPGRLNFDAEWALAWQEAGRRNADNLRFGHDEQELQRQLEAEAVRIAAGGSKPSSLLGIKKAATSKGAPAPLPPRQLKVELGDSVQVTVLPGKPPKPPQTQNGKPLGSEPSPRDRAPGQSANTAYSVQELEDLGWQVAKRVLETSDREPLVDFRNRQRVGADGAFDWTRFVELKACGRSMPSSVQMTLAEYTRAVECGRNYMLVLVAGLEHGCETKVKIILDPVRTATVSRSEAVRVSGLLDAPGIEIAVPDPGQREVCMILSG